jgi:hypothetical protein
MRLLAKWREVAPRLAATLALAFLGHLVAGDHAPLPVLQGLVALGALVLIGYAVAAFAPGRLPDIFWVSTIVVLLGLPSVPGAAFWRAQLEPLAMVPVMTPIMAFAALGIGADQVRLFRRIGWQMLIVSMLVFLGTYLGSTLIADLVLRVTA